MTVETTVTVETTLTVETTVTVETIVAIDTSVTAVTTGSRDHCVSGGFFDYRDCCDSRDYKHL